jgi:hypothetical protein
VFLKQLRKNMEDISVDSGYPGLEASSTSDVRAPSRLSEGGSFKVKLPISAIIMHV